MTKNIIIAALAFWNLILMVVLIYAGVKWGKPAELPAPDRAADATQINDTDTGRQEFTFKTHGHFAGGDAPLILNRALTITATFDAQGKDGVIIAQGGLGQGYALYVQDGELWFALRRLTVVTTVLGGKVSAGRHIATATLDKAGALILALDGNAPATGPAAGTISVQPVDGLDIGADRGEPIGQYQVPNSFGGTIEFVSLKKLRDDNPRRHKNDTQNLTLDCSARDRCPLVVTGFPLNMTGYDLRVRDFVEPEKGPRK